MTSGQGFPWWMPGEGTRGNACRRMMCFSNTLAGWHVDLILFLCWKPGVLQSMGPKRVRRDLATGPSNGTTTTLCAIHIVVVCVEHSVA